MSVNNYLFKYIYLVRYLKFRFYCLICSSMSNLNSADFLKIEMLPEFQNKTNIEINCFELMILDSPWIRQI